MLKFKILGAVCLAAALAASPAMARGFGGGGGAHVSGGGGAAHFSGGGGAAHFAGAGGAPHFAGNVGSGRHFAGGGPRGGGFRGGYGPGIGAGLVAGAVLGAGAYGYYGDSYAYDNSYDDGGYYNEPNGFVCQPGTWFRGADGRPHLCQ